MAGEADHDGGRPRCSCGCGTVIRVGSRFAPGHNNGRRWTPERIIAAIQQNR